MKIKISQIDHEVLRALAESGTADVVLRYVNQSTKNVEWGFIDGNGQAHLWLIDNWVDASEDQVDGFECFEVER